MKEKTKKVLTDILGLCVIAAILGLLFNEYNAKGIKLIRPDEQYNYIKESDIFASEEDSTLIDTTTTSQVIDTVASAKPAIDTAKLIEKVKEVKQKNEDVEVDNSAYRNVDKQFVKKHLNDSRVIIIDARSSSDYRKGHIGKAINIYPMEEDMNVYMNAVLALPMDKVYIIYCTGGNCDLSHHLYDSMKSLGFEKLYIFPGGWEEWNSK